MYRLLLLILLCFIPAQAQDSVEYTITLRATLVDPQPHPAATQCINTDGKWCADGWLLLDEEPAVQCQVVWNPDPIVNCEL